MPGIIEKDIDEHKSSIVYYAPDSFLEASPELCDMFREWAFDELQDEFREHNITVSDNEFSDPDDQVWTDDLLSLDEIKDFCERLVHMVDWDDFDELEA